MSRRQLMAEIDQLDHQLNLRIEIVQMGGALVRHQLAQLPPVVLVGSGALAGALTQRLGASRTWGMGLTGVRLLPLVQNVFQVARRLWSPL